MSREVEVYEEEKPEVIYIELFDQRPSGFILDGTHGKANQQELTAPLARFIPNFGYKKGYKEEVRNGKKVKVAYNEAIRYIKEQTEISVERQKALGIERSRSSKEDLIEIKRGSFSVVREGSFIGLFDYIKESFYNASNPDRSDRADKIYKVVEVGKEEEELNEYDINMADALRFVAQFYQKGGKGYIYKEDKINALCELFTIFADTMPGKITALNALAKREPKAFITKAQKFDQTNVTVVAHAIQLNVIRFNDNVVEYVNKEKIVANLGSEKLSHAAKIERLADLLQTNDFKAQNEELKFEVEFAKEQSLNA